MLSLVGTLPNIWELGGLICGSDKLSFIEISHEMLSMSILSIQLHTDQLCSDRAADQRLFFFCYIDSTIPLLSQSPISMLCSCTVRFVLDLVRNPKNRAQFLPINFINTRCLYVTKQSGCVLVFSERRLCCPGNRLRFLFTVEIKLRVVQHGSQFLIKIFTQTENQHQE